MARNDVNFVQSCARKKAEMFAGVRNSIAFTMLAAAVFLCFGCTSYSPGFSGRFRPPGEPEYDPPGVLDSRQFWANPASVGPAQIVLEIHEPIHSRAALLLVFKQALHGKLIMKGNSDDAVEAWLVDTQHQDISVFAAMSESEQSKSPYAARMAGSATILSTPPNDCDVSVQLADGTDDSRPFVNGRFAECPRWHPEYAPEYALVAVVGLPYFLLTGRLPI